MHLVSRWLPVFLWAGVIFFGSSLPPTMATASHWSDFTLKKMLHFAEYAILYLLLWRATRGNWRVSLLLCALYAVSDEFHQSFTPGREPTVRDVLIDTGGASGAGFVLWKYTALLPKRLKSWLVS